MNSDREDTGRPAAEVAVSEFLQRSFRPQRLKGKPCREYQEAVAWLERLLRRQAFLCDLADDNLYELQKFVASFGYGVTRVRTIKTRLSSLAKHAWRLGLIPQWRSVRLLDPSELRRERKRERFLRSPPTTGTLAAIFRDLVAPRLSREHGNNYGLAIRQFDRTIGQYSTPQDVTRENLAAFREHMLREGKASSTVYAYQHCIRRVARLADPSRLPPDARFNSGLPDPEPGTVRAFFAAEYRPGNLVGCSKTHLRDYRQTLTFLHRCFGRDLRVDELNDTIAAHFFTWLLDVRKLAPATVNGHRLRLFAVWRFAVQRGLLQRDPRVRKLRVDLDVPDAWSEDEVRRIIEAPALVPWRRHIAGIPGAKYFRALLLVVYWTGLRRRALLAIRRIDVDCVGGWLTVPGTAMKNRCGKRYRLGPDAIAAIAEIWEPERELLFPWSDTNLERFHYHIRRIIEASGVAPSTRRCVTRLHKMRRTVATLTALHRGLAAACELLGHSSVEVTKRYIDTSKLPGQDATEWLRVVTHNQPGTTRSTEREPKAWLDEADDLFRLGFHTAAGVTARIAAEHWLRSWAERARCPRGERRGIMGYAMALFGRSLIDKPAVSRLRVLIQSMNQAAHGSLVDPHKIAGVLSGVRELFDSFQPSKEK